MKIHVFTCWFMILLFLLGCHSNDISKRHGLENFDTLFLLQQSKSVQHVSNYLSKFAGWKGYNHDTTSGGFWINQHNKNAGKIYTLKISWFIPELQDSTFHIDFEFKDDSLRKSYLYQISKDSSFKLFDSTGLPGLESRSFRRGEFIITIGKTTDGYNFVGILQGHWNLQEDVHEYQP